MGSGFARFFYLLRRYGSRRVITALFLHGAPSRMAALAAYLADQDRREAEIIYIGNALYKIITIWQGKSALRPLSEIMHEDIVQDKRTASQIVAEVIEKLEK